MNFFGNQGFGQPSQTQFGGQPSGQGFGGGPQINQMGFGQGGNQGGFGQAVQKGFGSFAQAASQPLQATSKIFGQQNGFGSKGNQFQQQQQIQQSSSQRSGYGRGQGNQQQQQFQSMQPPSQGMGRGKIQQQFAQNQQMQKGNPGSQGKTQMPKGLQIQKGQQSGQPNQQRTNYHQGKRLNGEQAQPIQSNQTLKPSTSGQGFGGFGALVNSQLAPSTSLGFAAFMNPHTNIMQTSQPSLSQTRSQQSNQIQGLQQNQHQMMSQSKLDVSMTSQNESGFQSRPLQKQSSKNLGGFAQPTTDYFQKQLGQIQRQPSSKSVINNRVASSENLLQSMEKSSASQNSSLTKREPPKFLQKPSLYKSGSLKSLAHQASIVEAQPQEQIQIQNQIQATSKTQKKALGGKDSKKSLVLGKQSQKPSVLNITKQNQDAPVHSSNTGKKSQSGQKGDNSQLKGKAAKANEDEEEYGEQEYGDYYDEEYDAEEYYGEEGEDQYGPEDDDADYGQEEEVKKSATTLAKKNIANKDTSNLEVGMGAKKICQHFVAGNCKFGDKCSNLHEGKILEKQPCLYHYMNNCKHGQNCRNSHEFSAAQQQALQKILVQYSKTGQSGLTQAMILEMMGALAEKQPAPKKSMQEQPLKKPAVPNDFKPQNELSQNPKSQKPSGKVFSVAALKEENKILEEKKQKEANEIQNNPTQKIQSSLNNQFQIPSAPKMLKQQSIKKQEIELTSEIINQKRKKIFDDLKLMQARASQYLIPGIAECLQFCGDEEIKRRFEVETGAASPFEQDGGGQTFLQNAIKCFARSAADKIMNEPSIIRPPAVLYKVIEYLRDCIVDQDSLKKSERTFQDHNPSFLDVYSFVRDRGRCVANDLIILKDHLEPNIESIQCLKEFARFLILSFHHGFHIRNLDIFQNTQILTKTFGQLKDLFQSVKDNQNLSANEKAYFLKDENEFLSYLIIAVSNDPIISQDYIQSISLFSYPNSQRNVILKAIKINAAIQNGDAHFYFTVLKSRSTPYLIKCMMISFLNEMRLIQIENLRRFSNNETSLNFLTKALLFDESVEDFVSFVQTCGFPDFDLQEMSLKGRQSQEDWKGKFANWRQNSRLSFLDEQVGKRPRCLYIKEGLITEQTKEELQAQRELDLKKKAEAEKLLEEKKKLAAEALRIEQERKEAERAKRLQEEKERREKEQREREAREAEEKRLMEEKQRREAEEKLRMEKEKEKEILKQRTLKRFKDLALKLSDREDKKVEQKNRQSHEVVQQFSAIYKKASGKRQRRDIYQELALELVGMFNQQPIIPVNKRKQVIEEFNRIDFEISSQDNFKMRNWIAEIMPENKGFLQIKLLSSRIRPNNSPQQLWEILQSLILLFNNSDEAHLRKSTLTNQYRTDIHPDLEMDFKYEEIEKIKQNETLGKNLLLGTNLIMILTSPSKAEVDAQFLKDQLKHYCEYSRFNVIFLIYGTTINEINETLNKLAMKFIEEKKLEKISSMSFVPLCFNSFNARKQIRSNSSLLTIKSIVLAYLLGELKTILLKVETFSKEQLSQEKFSLKEYVNYVLDEANPFRQLDDVSINIKKFDKNMKLSIKSLIENSKSKQKQDSHSFMEKYLKKNEIQVLNFWLAIQQQMLEPIVEALKQSIQIAVQAHTEFDSHVEDAQLLLSYLKQIQMLVSMEMVNYPDEILKYQRAHVQYLIEQACRAFPVNVTQTLQSQLDYQYTFKTVAPITSPFRFYKGNCLYQMMMNLFYSMPMMQDESYLLVDPFKLCLKKNEIDLDKIERKIRIPLSESSNTLILLKNRFFQDFQPEQSRMHIFNLSNKSSDLYSSSSQDKTKLSNVNRAIEIKKRQAELQSLNEIQKLSSSLKQEQVLKCLHISQSYQEAFSEANEVSCLIMNEHEEEIKLRKRKIRIQDEGAIKSLEDRVTIDLTEDEDGNLQQDSFVAQNISPNKRRKIERFDFENNLKFLQEQQKEVQKLRKIVEKPNKLKK